MVGPIRSGLKKFYAELALLSIEFLVVAGLFLAAILVFITISRMIFWQHAEAFDRRVFDFLSGYTHAFTTQLMQFFSFLGSHQFMIPANIVLISYFSFFRKHRWYSIKIPVVAISSYLLMDMLKFMFHRPRPAYPLLETAQGLSFPSGHAMTSVTFYGLLIYLVWKNVSVAYIRWITLVALLLVILCIGTSRVYLRVHYASDVIAGFSMGLIWLVLSISILREIEYYTKRKVSSAIDASIKQD